MVQIAPNLLVCVGIINLQNVQNVLTYLQMTFKNPILQEYAEQIARDYRTMLENGIKGYDAIFKLAEENQMSRFQIYRYIKHAGIPIKKDRTKPLKSQ